MAQTLTEHWAMNLVDCHEVSVHKCMPYAVCNTGCEVEYCHIHQITKQKVNAALLLPNSLTLNAGCLPSK